MAGLDTDARIWLEHWIDDLLLFPNETEQYFKSFLKATGIVPEFEALLGTMIGIASGYVQSIYLHKFNRCLESEEILELINLLERRIWEVRQSIMETRVSRTCTPIGCIDPGE
jgi:hypothetical protein